MTNRYLVSRSRFIAAAPEAIFEVLATPALHSVIDGSDTVKGAQPRGPERLALGAKFGMEMNIKVDYKILNTVCEFEEGRRIAWQHFGGHIWRYLLEPGTDAAGTRRALSRRSPSLTPIWRPPGNAGPAPQGFPDAEAGPVIGPCRRKAVRAARGVR
jgi:hypothetical protein